MRNIISGLFLFLISTFISCEKESLYKIGQEYGGGIIFYIDSSGEHGLIAAPIDQSDSAVWGCETIKIIGAEGTSIGSGLQNTIDIVNGCSAQDIAARICYDLILNDFDDWFLPSKEELNLMYLNKNIIGNFTNGPYWSSSEHEIHHAAWCQNFSIGEQTIYDKYRAYYVRAIRAF